MSFNKPTNFFFGGQYQRFSGFCFVSHTIQHLFHFYDFLFEGNALTTNQAYRFQRKLERDVTRGHYSASREIRKKRTMKNSNDDAEYDCKICKERRQTMKRCTRCRQVYYWCSIPIYLVFMAWLYPFILKKINRKTNNNSAYVLFSPLPLVIFLCNLIIVNKANINS